MEKHATIYLMSSSCFTFLAALSYTSKRRFFGRNLICITKKIWLKIYTNKTCDENTPTPERIPSQNQMGLFTKISLVSCQIKSANSVSVKEDTYEGAAAKLYGCCWPRITRSYGRGAMIRISWRRWLHEDVTMRAECRGGCWKPPVEKTVKCTQKARPWRHCKHTTARTETVCVTR